MKPNFAEIDARVLNVTSTWRVEKYVETLAENGAVTEMLKRD